MACLKCGRELAEGQSFCNGCREDMAQHPVKPDTPVHIIPRPVVQTEKKQSRKDKQSDKQQHAHLRSAIRWLTAAVGILTVVSCLLAGILLHTLAAEPKPEEIGRNYTVIES